MGTIMILFLISFLTRVQGAEVGKKESNASGQRVVDCPQSFSNHHNEADSYNGRDDEKSVRIRK